MPFDAGELFAADVGYVDVGAGWPGHGTPYASMASSAMGYRGLRY